ncbi:MAG: MarR family transcriptional regulator [bacterium]|nr:MarR family transcriptional regulator [bacterium]
MPNAHARETLDGLAEEIFELTSMSSAVRSASKRGAAGQSLTETEFLALDALAKNSPQTVGAIQKTVGVLPAQMSRVVRALEDKPSSPLIECQINPQDRRRIDVTLTAAGRKAHTAYREARLGLTKELLREMSVEDREEFMRLLRLLRMGIAKRLKSR